MIGAVVQKELKTYLRSGVFISLAVAIIALVAAAAALSAQRISTFERERVAAQAVDSDVWNSQGARNPHAAAHFARYAFKPVPQLAAFDPGVTDHTGMALWMEAHYQNPAVFRRAEDLGDTGRIAEMSPAWILQFIAPLFIFLILFAAVAGEREAGTLRQMATAGLRPEAVFIGKLLGAVIGLAVIVVPALALSLLMTGGGQSVPVLPDVGFRMVGLVCIYAVFVVAIGAFAVGVSAFFKEKRSALIALVGIWAVSFMMTPRLASSIAATAFAQPDASALSKDLDDASSASIGDEAHREEIQKAILEEYGVEKIEELPINYGGYSLQKSEEYAHPIFEGIYARLDALHDGQEKVLQVASLVSPAMALQKLSAGLAGVDRTHHQEFTAAAEVHRRKTVKMLNDDLKLHGGGQQQYTGDESLWRQVEDFNYHPPRFAAISSNYIFSAVVLIFYLLGSIVFAGWAVKRTQKRIAS